MSRSPRPRPTPGRTETGLFAAVAAVVRSLPRGCVITYGQVARLAGRPRAARAVGWALASLPEGSDVPWHRVLSAGGRIPPRAGGAHLLQARLLRAEGVAVRAGRVDLARFGFSLAAPRRPAPRRSAG